MFLKLDLKNKNAGWESNKWFPVEIHLSYIYLSYIYLGYFVCLCVIVCVCVCVTIAEGSAILLVLAIKLTKVTRRRAWRGRDRDGEIGKRQIVEGGYEET